MARGQKTGGRKRGTRNKATVERLLRAERANAEAQWAGKRMAKDVLDEFMHAFAETAARFRDVGDWAGFERWALHSVECARALAPYQRPKLSAVVVGATAVTKIEVVGGLPDDEDGSLVDGSAVGPNDVGNSIPDLAKGQIVDFGGEVVRHRSSQDP